MVMHYHRDGNASPMVVRYHTDGSALPSRWFCVLCDSPSGAPLFECIFVIFVKKVKMAFQLFFQKNLQAQGSASTRAMAKQSERKRINREAETQRQLKRRRAAAEAGHKRERKAETERRSAQGPRTGRQEESKRRPSAGVQF